MSISRFEAFVCENVLLEGEICKGGIIVDENGKIYDIIKGDCNKVSQWANVTQIKHGVLMPGLVDSHVHVNSPGRSEWEDFPCATRAAAAGGVTTIVDMPLNSLPPTTTFDNLKIKIEEARKSPYVDIAFWGGVIPGNQNELIPMIEAGVIGFKCFLCPSGVDEFPNVEYNDLCLALEKLQHTDSVLAFHAECEIEQNNNSNENSEDYCVYLNSRPPEMEYEALSLIEKLSNKYQKARYHIVHVSASKVVDKVNNMKKRGISITAETCPHYLTLSAETIPKSATEFKCAPPIRSSTNQDELWNYICNKEIDMIVSDHSPCTPSLKTTEFMKSWGGISSLQFGISLIWTNAIKYGLTLVEISELMSAMPAKLCRLDDQKGAFKIGLDADFIVFDPDDKYIIDSGMIHHKNKLTPYLGMELKGKVLSTYLRGKKIYDGNSFSDSQGKLLLKQEI